MKNVFNNRSITSFLEITTLSIPFPFFTYFSHFFTYFSHFFTYFSRFFVLSFLSFEYKRIQAYLKFIIVYEVMPI
jgi:hypothetical protein